MSMKRILNESRRAQSVKAYFIDALSNIQLNVYFLGSSFRVDSRYLGVKLERKCIYLILKPGQTRM